MHILYQAKIDQQVTENVKAVKSNIINDILVAMQTATTVIISVLGIKCETKLNECI